jgi:hypothetical protein
MTDQYDYSNQQGAGGSGQWQGQGQQGLSPTVLHKLPKLTKLHSISDQGQAQGQWDDNGQYYEYDENGQAYQEGAQTGEQTGAPYL